MTNAQYHSIMMMLNMIMSLQVKGSKLWTWFWIFWAAYDMVMAIFWTWVIK